MELLRLNSAHNRLHKVIFVHGLLGSHRDWHEVVTYLDELSGSSIECLGVDLPGHNGSPIEDGLTFDTISEELQHLLNRLDRQLTEQGIWQQAQVIIVGYSLGARLLMMALAQDKLNFSWLKKIIIEGGNPGLQKKEQRQLRLQHDQKWADAFRHAQEEPVDEALHRWYQQEVFASLSSTQRKQLVAERRQHSLPMVASMLLATSLGKQPYLWASLSHRSQILLVVGENDQKFKGIYQQLDAHLYTIADAGHNAHKEQPSAFALMIKQELIPQD